MRVRHRRGVGGSLAGLALLLAPAGLGTATGEPVERDWGGAGEPGLHRLLRELVGETGAQRGGHQTLSRGDTP